MLKTKFYRDIHSMFPKAMLDTSAKVGEPMIVEIQGGKYVFTVEGGTRLIVKCGDSIFDASLPDARLPQGALIALVNELDATRKTLNEICEVVNEYARGPLL